MFSFDFNNLVYWRRLVKNRLLGRMKILGGKVEITDETLGVSQLSGAPAQVAPKSTPMIWPRPIVNNALYLTFLAIF